MLATLKCIEIVKEFHLETYELKAEIKLAEIINLLEMPTEALKIIERIAEKLQLLNNTQLKAETEIIKAKILIKLQKSISGKNYGGSSAPLYESAVVSLKKALELSISQCNLPAMREIYYILSRVYHELNQAKKRDEAALNFLYADEEYQDNSKHFVGYVCHFDLPEMIDETRKQIDIFTAKYSQLIC